MEVVRSRCCSSLDGCCFILEFSFLLVNIIMQFKSLALSVIALTAAATDMCIRYDIVNNADTILSVGNATAKSVDAYLDGDSSASQVAMCLKNTDGDLYFKLQGSNDQSCDFHFYSRDLSNFKLHLNSPASSTGMKCLVDNMNHKVIVYA